MANKKKLAPYDYDLFIESEEILKTYKSPENYYMLPKKYKDVYEDTKLYVERNKRQHEINKNKKIPDLNDYINRTPDPLQYLDIENEQDFDSQNVSPYDFDKDEVKRKNKIGKKNITFENGNKNVSDKTIPEVRFPKYGTTNSRIEMPEGLAPDTEMMKAEKYNKEHPELSNWLGTAERFTGGLLKAFADSKPFGDVAESLGKGDIYDKAGEYAQRGFELSEAHLGQEGDKKKLRGRWKEGDYKGAINQAWREAMQSTPLTATAMVAAFTGHPVVGFNLMTAQGYGQKKLALENAKDLDMKEGMQQLNAFGTGLNEATWELIGAYGEKWLNKLLLSKPLEVVRKEIAKRLITRLAKYGLAYAGGSFGEGVEEFFSQIGENIIDYKTGKVETLSLFDGAIDAFISGTAAGALMEAPASIGGSVLSEMD
ncbi:MAG: hypothetical protein B6I17_04510, partial [Tenericutes bacterium 4572_104]